jgi:archaellum component FlaC
MRKSFDAIDKRFDKVENEIVGIKMTIENEIRPNIQAIAESVDGMNSRLDAFVNSQAGAIKRIESLELYIMALDKRVRELEEKAAS